MILCSIHIFILYRYILCAGVEMEALTGVSVAALTVYDMVKAVAPEAIISDIRLERKLGGKTGSWLRACR